MLLPLPPHSWIRRDEPERSLIRGFDPAPFAPLAVLLVGALALAVPWLRAGLRLWLSAVVLATVVAALRGFRLEIGPGGFVFERTWAGLSFRSHRLPLDAEVHLAGGPGDLYDRLVIERPDRRKKVSIGSRETCHELYRAIVAARERWTSAAAGSCGDPPS